METKLDVQELEGEVGIEGKTLKILPRNFDNPQRENKLYEDSYTYQKLLENKGISVELPEEDEEAEIVEKSADVTIPALCFGIEFVIENWEQILVTIEIIQKYLERTGAETARFSYVLEEEDKSEKISYEGPVEGLDKCLEPLKEFRE